MDDKQLAELLGKNAIIGYQSRNGKTIMSADLANGISIEIEIDGMPISMVRSKQDGADYIAKALFAALNTKAF